VALLGAEVVGDLLGDQQRPVGLDLQVDGVVEELLEGLRPGRYGEDGQHQTGGHPDHRQHTPQRLHAGHLLTYRASIGLGWRPIKPQSSWR
jgi:hypothetical protein